MRGCQKLRVGDFRVLIDWDKDNETIYAIDVFERKNEYRELGKYREVWGSWRDKRQKTDSDRSPSDDGSPD